MTPTISIRPRVGTDSDFIRSLGAAAFGEYDRKAGDYSVAASARAATFVAEQAGERVGFAVAERERDGAFHLAAIAVVESARGIGVGAALVSAVEAHARAHGATTIHLTTADSNVAAIAAFRRAGFRIKKGGEGTYRRGQRTVWMEKGI